MDPNLFSLPEPPAKYDEYYYETLLDILETTPRGGEREAIGKYTHVVTELRTSGDTHHHTERYGNMYFHRKITHRGDLLPFMEPTLRERSVNLGQHFLTSMQMPNIYECADAFVERFAHTLPNTFNSGYVIPSDLLPIVTTEHVRPYEKIIGEHLRVSALVGVVVDYLFLHGIPAPNNIMLMVNLGINVDGFSYLPETIELWIQSCRVALRAILRQLISTCSGTCQREILLDKYNNETRPITETRDKHCVQLGMRIDDEDDDLCWAVFLQCLARYHFRFPFPDGVSPEHSKVLQTCLIHRVDMNSDFAVDPVSMPTGESSELLSISTTAQPIGLQFPTTVTCIIYKVFVTSGVHDV